MLTLLFFYSFLVRKQFAINESANERTNDFFFEVLLYKKKTGNEENHMI